MIFHLLRFTSLVLIHITMSFIKGMTDKISLTKKLVLVKVVQFKMTLEYFINRN